MDTAADDMKRDKFRVLITRRIAESEIARLAEIDLWLEPRPLPHDELVRRIRDAEGVLSMLTDRLDAATIAAAPTLRAISNLAVGVDNIDLGAATLRGIAVGHTPGVLTETTAELAFALMMAVARRIVEAAEYVTAAKWVTWSPDILVGRDLNGATLGIVGFGAIGQAVAQRAAGFGMRVLYTSRGESKAHKIDASRVTLDELLRQSDFVSLHVPLTPETRGLVGARELALMKPDAILINTARGEIVNQTALIEALRRGRLRGAGLDVTSPEPINVDDPLPQMADLVVTPANRHADETYPRKMAQLAVDNLLAGLRGERMKFCANPKVYEK